MTGAGTPPAATTRLKVKLQVMRGDDIALGPGKAALLDAIAAHGSISAAARAIGMSYRRAWLLVETCNKSFAAPLVTAQPGEGAQLTPNGQAMLAAYRALEEAAAALSGHPAWARLAAALAADSET